MIYNFFVDTSIYPNRGDFTLNLHTPVIITDKERLRFKLINFSSLNNIYNISQELNNNTINIKRYKKELIYGQSPALTVSPILRQVDVLPYYTTTGTLLPQADASQHITYSTNLINFYVEEVVLENYIIYLRDGRITANNVSPAQLYFRNMFLDTPTTDPDLMIPCFNQNKIIDKWFIINKPSGFLDQLNRVEVDIQFIYDGHTNPDAGTITVEICKQTSGVVSVIGTVTSNYTIADMLANNSKRIVVPVTADPNTPTSTYIVRFSTTGFKNHATTQFFFKKLNFIKNDFGYYEESNFPVELDQTYNLTIPDGIYSATNLIAKINSLLVEVAIINTMISLQTYNYKMLISNVDIITGLTQYDLNNQFIFTFPAKLANMLGFNNEILLNRMAIIEGSGTINLTNFQKYIITSSLKVKDNQHLFLRDDEYLADGVGDVVAVINKDIAPFQYINYINEENVYYDIENKMIHNINFKILNEFKQQLPSMPSATLHFQLITYKNK